jgi:hypothetical protein
VTREMRIYKKEEEEEEFSVLKRDVTVSIAVS